jgi:hypothetical protein
MELPACMVKLCRLSDSKRGLAGTVRERGRCRFRIVAFCPARIQPSPTPPCPLGLMGVRDALLQRLGSMGPPEEQHFVIDAKSA